MGKRRDAVVFTREDADRLLEAAEDRTVVTVPEGVTVIDRDAFSNRPEIRRVTLPETVTAILDCAFSRCGSLEEINLPKRLSRLGKYALTGTRITKIDIPEKITRLRDGTFALCSMLAEVSLPGKLKIIGQDVFNVCGNLTGIRLPLGLEKIGKGAFHGTRLAEIDLPGTVTEIGPSAFDGCWQLRDVRLPEFMQEIPDFAFVSCGELRSVILPPWLIRIGRSAFARSGITGIDLPESLAEIDYAAFAGCGQLAEIRIPGNVGTLSDYTFSGCTGLERVSLPGGLAEIGACAFMDCGGLAEITLPGSLRSIREQAFLNCGSLRRLVLPKGIRDVSPDAFMGCVRLSLEAEDGGDTYAQEYVRGWQEAAEEEKRTVILHCPGCGEPCTEPLNPSFSRIADTKLFAYDADCREEPVPGSTVTMEVYFPFYCKIGGFFSAVYGKGQFMTGILSEIVSREKSEAVIRAHVLKTGDRLSFVRRLPEEERALLAKSRRYSYTPPRGDAPNPMPEEIDENLIVLSNDFGGDVYYVDVLYTDEDGVDHLVVTAYHDFHESWTAFGDQVLGLHKYRPFRWENDFMIHRRKKSLWKCREDITDAVIPEGIREIGYHAFRNCAKLRTLTLPASLRWLYYASFGEHPELKQIRLAAPLRAYPRMEEALRSLFSDAEIRYI